jgi:hypothetical protein
MVFQVLGTDHNFDQVAASTDKIFEAGATTLACKISRTEKVSRRAPSRRLMVHVLFNSNIGRSQVVELLPP